MTKYDLNDSTEAYALQCEYKTYQGEWIKSDRYSRTWGDIRNPSADSDEKNVYMKATKWCKERGFAFCAYRVYDCEDGAVVRCGERY